MSDVLSPMYATFVAFRPFNPAFKIEIVIRNIKGLVPTKHPLFKMLHELPDMLHERFGVRASLFGDLLKHDPVVVTCACARM